MASLCTPSSIEQRREQKIEVEQARKKLLDSGKREAFILAVEMHLYLNAMLEPTARELIVLEPTVLEDWSLLRTSCCLSRMMSSKKNQIRMMKNGSWSLWMIRNRRRSWKRTICCCDPNHVAKSQCCLRLAWRPHLDHRGGHFRRHRVLEGYWRWADYF